MFWKAISYCTLVGVLGYGIWGASKIFTAKTPDADVVGIRARTSSTVLADGSSPKEYIEVERRRPPYQVHGGKERNNGTIPYKHGGSTTRTFFMPKGVWRVSGYAYGDCNFDFDRDFSVSAISLGPGLGQDTFYFIRRLLPRGRQFAEYDGVLRVEKSDNFVFEVESDSPLWGMRIERLRKGTDITWDGEKVGLRKPRDRKHCWSEDRIIREKYAIIDKRDRERQDRIDKEDAKRERERDRIQLQRERQMKRQRDRIYR